MKGWLKLIKEKAETVLNKIDSALVYLYRQYSFIKILYSKKTRNLKKIHFRRLVFKTGYIAGKKLNCQFIKNFFRVQ